MINYFNDIFDGNKNMMRLEYLANELLLDLFEYFDVINLFRAFTRLNHRFNQLIFIHLQRYHLDFRSISKIDFQLFCQEYLPLINNRIISVHLSDDIETPNLPQIFLSFGYSINQFIHLKSITIDHTCSFDLLNQITFQCYQLTFLTHLNLTIHNHEDPDENFRQFIHNIWNLRQLSHCYLNLVYPYIWWLLQILPISQSMKCLSLKNISINSDNLFNLFEHTPQLQRLSIGNLNHFNTQRSYPIFNSLISLNIIIESSKPSMKDLFKQLPNLSSLTIQLNNIHIDGYEWQMIFNNYFHNLKIFRLKMTIELSFFEDIDEQIDQLLNSYQTDYWIEKHRWFVQCDWCPMKIMKTAILYTLPYAFDTFHYNDGIQSKSTLSKQFNSFIYHQVDTLHHVNRKRNLSINWISPSIKFQNIRYLKVTLPCDDSFWLLMPTLDRLTSFHVVLTRDFGYSQLQMLLDRAPCLYSLAFSHSNNFVMSSFNINSTSIRRLEFFQNVGYHLRYFNRIDCTTLSRSPIASQCKVLLIDVANRNDILWLTEIMPHLQVIHVRCAREQSDQYPISEINETLITWLRDHLSSRYTISIIRNPYNNDHINLWAN